VVAVSKTDACKRQLDAAIRLFLADDDALAIHTLAAASYRIIRDLKEKRGKTELDDMLSNAGFNIASKLATGELSSLPEGVEAESQYGQIILSFVEDIRSGELQDMSQISISVRNENKHWREFNAAANFLKHADQDYTEAFDFSGVDNMRLLSDACRSFAELTGLVTPEIIAFQLWRDPIPEFMIEHFPDYTRDVEGLAPRQRRIRSLNLLTRLKVNEIASDIATRAVP
jgi:hypothetical protein